jgi:hypothetical protein
VRATAFFAVLCCSACGILRNCPADLVGTYEWFVPSHGDPAAGVLHKVILRSDGDCEMGHELVPPPDMGMGGMFIYLRWHEVDGLGGGQEPSSSVTGRVTSNGS